MNIYTERPKVKNKLVRKDYENKTLLIDSEKPSWVSVSKSMADLILNLDGEKTIKEIIEDTNKKITKDVSEKLILGFEKLYKLKFFDDGANLIADQSETLDQVYLNLTKRCNLSCSYCYTKADINSKVREMPVEFWVNQVRRLKELNPKSTICFTGGEAILFKGFWELAEKIKNIGIELSLITNGTVSQQKDASRYKALFRNIKVSIDSVDENINSITRGVDSLRKAKEFIDALIDEKFKPTIMVVVTKANYKWLSDFKAVFNENVFITFQPMYKMGRASDKDNLGLTADEYYKALDLTEIDKMKGSDVLKRNRKLLWCGMGRNVLSIESDGRVYPCHLLHNEELLLGNLNHEDIGVIWSRSPYRKNSVDNIDECRNCEIKYLCGAPCRARAYFVTGNIFKRDPLCPDFIKRSHIENMIGS